MATLQTDQLLISSWAVMRFFKRKYTRNGVSHFRQANRTSQDIPQQGYKLPNYVKRVEGACSMQQVKAYRDEGVSFLRYYCQLFR